MARFKVLAHRMIGTAAWLATGAGALAAVYGASAVAAHVGTWVDWR